MRFALGWREKLIFAFIVCGLILAVAVQATKAITWMFCGAWPQPVDDYPFLIRIFQVFTGNIGAWVGTANGCVAPAWASWAALIGVLLLITFIALAVYQVNENRKLTPKYLRKQLLSRKEVFAGRKEVAREVGQKVAVERGRKVRPVLSNELGKQFKAEDAAFKLGSSQGIDVFLSMEDAILLIGPPRSGKGYGILTRQIIETPGPVVTTSTRGDNMEATILARAERGPVFVFDPENVTGRKSTLKWSPISGCENPKIAQRRAQMLVTATGLMEGENQEFGTKAVEVVQALLHAAAVGKASLSELYLWSKNPERAREAVYILAQDSNVGWEDSLRATIDLPVEQRSSAWFGVSMALTPVDVPTTRALFDPTEDDPIFNIDEFLNNNGTLYLISPMRTKEQTASVGVLLIMLLDAIAEAAHRKAMMSDSGRLDPPLGLILDEVANVFPWPQLPQWCAAGSGEGIQVTTVVQARSQLREGWGSEGAQTIWESSGIKTILGGGGSDSDLKEAIGLLDEQTWRTTNSSWSTDRDESWSENLQMKEGMTVAELRRLPELMALLIVRRARAIAVDLVPWTAKPEIARLVNASKAWHKDNPISTDPLNPGNAFLSAAQIEELEAGEVK